MKKTLLTLSAAVACAFAANAQVSIIPKAGISLANMATKEDEDVDDDEKSKYNMGLTAGVGFNFAVSEAFSLQPELLYIQKGLKYQEGDEYSKIHLNYLEIPVLAKVSFGSETVKAFVNAGPSFGYALGGKSKYKYDDESGSQKIRFGDKESTEDTEYYDTKYVSRLDLGLQFGGGVGFQAGPGMFMLDARYGLGLSNFFKATKETFNGITVETDADGKNRALALTVGYAIPLGGN